MCSGVESLTAGHTLQQHSAELFAKDAVDYEVHRAGRERK